jgi:RHS repeat-associated protein
VPSWVIRWCGNTTVKLLMTFCSWDPPVEEKSGYDLGARYYSSTMGRWMSPDWADKPEAVPYSSLDNPQSLNLYGYVLNNPLGYADKDGHCCESDFNSFSDHPGQFKGGSDPMDRQFAGAVVGGDSHSSFVCLWCW